MCFRCGERYSPGHLCKLRHLNFIITEDEEDGEFLDTIGEQEENTGNLGQVVEVYLHTLTNLMKRKTLRLQGILKGKIISVLIDTGSTSSFLSKRLATELELQEQKMEMLKATIANRSIVISDTFCPSVN